MNEKRSGLMEILSRSQQWGSPLLPWLIVEVLGASLCILPMFPASLLLATVGFRMSGNIGAVLGMVVPIITGIEIWNGIKRRLKNQ